MSRLITTFDEVPPYRPTRFTSRTIMVFPYSKRVPPKSFVRPRINENARFSKARDPQGLRRPRFSFFIFTCQTARDPKTPLPWPGGPQNPVSTANDNRFASAVTSLIKERSFTGAKTCLGHGPRQRRAQWAVYKPARSALSTVVVNKSSDPRREFCNAENSPHQTFAPYLSHIPATF